MQYNNLTIEQFNNRKRGQALLFVLFLVFIVAILTGGLASMWKSEINIRTLEKNNLLAFYLAQAGIEEAKIAARYGEITADSGWNDFGAGRYSYGIADVGANKRELTGTGQIVGGGGNPAAMRQIKMLIKGIENPNSDTTNDAKEDWSWREL